MYDNVETSIGLLYRFFGECPEALQLFDGDGDTSSSEFRAHATRVITSLQEEIEHLQEHDSSEHKHEEDAPLSNTTPTINTVCITNIFLVEDWSNSYYVTYFSTNGHLIA